MKMIKKLLVFIVLLGYHQVLIADEKEAEIISPELQLDEVQFQKDDKASAILRSNDENAKLPHGLTLTKHSSENEDYSHESIYKFRQNGKVVDTIEGYYIYDFYDGDMDKDGVRDLIFKTYSGGAHCCFDLYIAQVTQEMKKLTKVPLRNLDSIELKDLDSDGIKEWVMYDDRYSYFHSCFACSPAVQIVATYKKGKLILRPNLTKKHTVSRLEKLTSSHVSLDNYGFLQLNQEYAPEVINSFLYHFYTGNINDALSVINKYLIFEGRGIKLLFLQELMESMKESYFWDQLRKINHFYDEGGVSMGSSVSFFDAESIAGKLFEKLEDMHEEAKRR